MEMIDYFAENHMFGLVEKALELINDQETYKFLYFQCLIHTFNKNYDESITVCNNVLQEKPNSLDVVRIKALNCFYSCKYMIIKGREIL